MHREGFPWDELATLAALAGGLVCVDLLAEMMSFSGAAPTGLSLGAHAVTGALAARAVPNARDAKTRGLAAHLAVWLTVAGALGALVWVAVVIAEVRRREALPLFADEIDAEIDDDPVEAIAAIAGSIRDRRVRIEGASAVRPLRDVLTEAPTQAQLRALAALAQNYDPGMAHALTLALSSQEASVRVLAATALAKLHQAYGAQIDAHAAQLKAAPSQRVAAHWVALGRARLAFARSGLLNPDRRSTVLEQAEAAFAAALSLDGALAPAQTGCAISCRARPNRPLVSTSPRPRPCAALTPMRPLQ